MNVLIVESHSDLGRLWQRHLERMGMQVELRHSQDAAIEYLSENEAQIIVLNLVLRDGAALAVADFANYRQPDARVVFVTNTSFFSDGSIFAHFSNARALIPADTPPEDLAVMVDHYGRETG